MTLSLNYKCKTREAAKSHVLKWQSEGEKVVFTNGCFDIVHAGHIQYLTEAKALGGKLVLGLNSDASVSRLKGPERPINNQENRAIVLAAFYMIDIVVIFEEDTPIELIQTLKPDIHVKGGDYKPEELPEYPVIMEYGGKVKILSFKPGLSSSSIINKLKKQP